ncbi:hypothetical protein BSKO_04272 [Bryopsis sp. KO-2023]|nr:hypothetical protein BSKO_04272 [Bryopsis sp. KO-2023]
MHSQNVCTPETILELAEYFGVGVSEESAEFYLLPIVKAAAEIPQDTAAPSYKSKISICKPPDIENIRFLCFKSWWNEDLESADLTFRDNGWQAGGGLGKRYIGLKFDLAQKNFHVQIDSTQQSVKISNMKHVTAKNGSPLQCWDLHVGAKLDILGKTVTLMQASLETSLWIDSHKKKMARLKAELEELVKKYRYRPFVNAIAISKESKLPGGASLRSLIDQISHIIQVLADFRPALAAKYRQRLESAANPAQ